jgi:Ner family transcriptional regulator
MDFWSANRIIAEVRARGISLRQLSLQSGLKEQTLTATIQKPNARGEAVIAAFLGVPAYELWPDRYASTGHRYSPQPVRNYKPKPRFSRNLEMAA